MLASILQLTGAIVLGYYLAFRTKAKSRQAVRPKFPVKGQKYTRYLEAYTETYAYRIGFVFITIGYLIQVAEIDLLYFNKIDAFCRVAITSLFTIILTYLSKLLAEWLGKRTYDKKGEFNPDDNPQHGDIMIDE